LGPREFLNSPFLYFHTPFFLQNLLINFLGTAIDEADILMKVDRILDRKWLYLHSKRRKLRKRKNVEKEVSKREKDRYQARVRKFNYEVAAEVELMTDRFPELDTVRTCVQLPCQPDLPSALNAPADVPRWEVPRETPAHTPALRRAIVGKSVSCRVRGAPQLQRSGVES